MDISCDIRIRFEKKVDRTSSCWEWQAAKTYDGYGVMKINKKVIKAHRIAWQLFCGPIDDGVCVLHTCNNPSCVNPKHLFLGSNVDNIADKVAKGRQIKGEAQYLAKLTEEDVRAIRRSSGTQTAIAKEYGVDQSIISEIKNWKIWKHV